MIRPGAVASPIRLCGEETLSCVYDGKTLCSCQRCECPLNGCQFVCPQNVPIGTLGWYCTPPPLLTSPCPASVPNEGTDCDEPATVQCPAGNCGRLNATCTDGAWRWSYPQTGCPVCASPDTPIATPDGERPIASIRVGELVYSVVGQGIEAVPVLRVGHTAVFQHHVVRVKMANGRSLDISAGHPTADGRLFDDLRHGGMLDGQPIESVEIVPYRHTETFDILPASEGGTYFAAGLLIGSTLGP